MSINMFIQILNHLPNLSSIRVSDFPFENPINTLDPDFEIWERFLDNNKITKLTLRNIEHIKDVPCIIVLFPRIHYLALGFLCDVDFRRVLRSALIRIQDNDIRHLKTICIYTFEAKYDQLLRLMRIIDSENLLQNYTIHQQWERFYLQWE